MYKLGALIDRIRRSGSLTDRLPFDWMVDDRTLFTKAGGFVWVAHAIGPDLAGTSSAVIDTYFDQLAAIEGALGDGWTIYHDQWRWWNDANLALCDFGSNKAAQLIDAAERRQFAADKALDRTLFIAIHYEPDGAHAGLLEWLAHKDADFTDWALLNRFREDAGKFFGSLALIMPSVKLLEGDALWSYFSQTVNYEPWPAAMPLISVNLSRGLASLPWRTGTSLQIGRQHLRTVELFSLGALTADTIRALDSLRFEHRWCVRIDTTARHQQAKWLARMRAEYNERRQTWWRRTLQHFTRKDEGDSNPEAAWQMSETDQLRVDVQLGDQGFAPITMNVHVWDEDEEIVRQRAIDVELTLKDLGFRAETATLASVLAPLADIPGNDAQPREVPAVFAQITRISPVTSTSRGEITDGKWDGPALTLGYAASGVPVRFAWHGPGEQLGNTAIIGQSRGGKSALLAKLIAATLKYQDSRVLVFDIGRSFLPTCLCLGGDWHELGQNTRAVQPLRHVDQPEAWRNAFEWLCRALAHQGVQRNHDTDHALTQALRLVELLPADQRTMTALVNRIGSSMEVREALRAFTVDGHWGETFDGVVESYGQSRVVGIEVGAVRRSDALPLIVSAVFDAIRFERMKGQPCVVVFDEFHELIKRAAFRDEIDRFAREIAKHNGVMVLATQSPADMGEDLAAVVDAQCQNRILIPDPKVLEPNQMRFYKALGYTEDELRDVASGYQKADYFVRTPNLRGKMTIRLTDEAAVICGRTKPIDIQHCFQLLAEGVKPGEEFTAKWLEYTETQAEERAA